mmetsp:Transcript_35142/g.53922  ORF Transcript_35142/g.53922 Transcript_35142/m.53922 type:complete len:711 (+) Transcript_35142:1036-3168(+)
MGTVTRYHNGQHAPSAGSTHSSVREQTQEIDDVSPQIHTTRYGSLPTLDPQHYPQQPQEPQQQQPQDYTTTLHAQSLVLGLAFFAIWSPQNIMAPNLTQMAADFGFSSEIQRDFYLGANLALATGVLSFPVAGGIGVLADMVSSRKHLFAWTVLLGGLASIATGHARTYTQLYMARFVNGGCMSGSVPVAFSLLGDLFDTHQRNAASSGLTAMMGGGIIMGQVYAGVVGDTKGWSHAFYVSGVFCMICACLVICMVQEPIRGGKEKVLQELIENGSKYEKKLTWSGFLHALQHNRSNRILMWQGFFSSLPWGLIFVFLNDYLSQERGLSVPDATFLVFMFGIGCALGGVWGGYLGQVCNRIDRSLLPVFMALTTFLGIIPFLLLLDVHYHTSNVWSSLYAFTGGIVASLPSVNVRPCILNVNPPETRGAALTAANLIIQLARGAGPSLVSMGAIWNIDRQASFNISIIVFWTITSIQLLMLSRTLPEDQDAMDKELERYAKEALLKKKQRKSSKLSSPEATTSTKITTPMTKKQTPKKKKTTFTPVATPTAPPLPTTPVLTPTMTTTMTTTPMSSNTDSNIDDDDSNSSSNNGLQQLRGDTEENLVSIEERIMSFDAGAARESLEFMGEAWRELAHLRPFQSSARELMRTPIGSSTMNSRMWQSFSADSASTTALRRNMFQAQQNRWSVSGLSAKEEDEEKGKMNESSEK